MKMELTLEFIEKRIAEQKAYISEVEKMSITNGRRIELIGSAMGQLKYFEGLLPKKTTEGDEWLVFSCKGEPVKRVKGTIYNPPYKSFKSYGQALAYIACRGRRAPSKPWHPRDILKVPLVNPKKCQGGKCTIIHRSKAENKKELLSDEWKQKIDGMTAVELLNEEMKDMKWALEPNIHYSPAYPAMCARIRYIRNILLDQKRAAAAYRQEFENIVKASTAVM